MSNHGSSSATSNQLQSQAVSSSRPRLPARPTTTMGAPRRQCCFSFAAYARSLMDHLRKCGVRVEVGLADSELKHIELELGFNFPPDLRAILHEGLPVGSTFPDWRSAPLASLKARMQQPMWEVLLEVKKKRLWCDKWGIRPPGAEQAEGLASDKLKQVPVLVPVYGNCFIPATETAGNPVLQVQSGEVSVFGNDVADFFEKEVFQSPVPVAEEPQEEDDHFQSSCLMAAVRNNSSSSSSSRSSEEKSASSSSSWGKSLDFFLNRNPEALFSAFRKKKGGFSRAIRDSSRSAEASPRPSVSSTHSNASGVAEPPRRSLDVLWRRKTSTLHSSKVEEALLGLSSSSTTITMAAPAWAAKRPKKVEFWSDLCGDKPDLGKLEEKSSDFEAALVPAGPKSEGILQIQSKSQVLSAESAQIQSRSGEAEVHQEEQSCNFETLARICGANSTVGTSGQISCGTVPNNVKAEESQGWLDGYLDDMAGRLRTAGWKEDDICEMMVSTDSAISTSSVSARNSKAPSNAIVPRDSRQAVIQGLVLKVQELSDSLKKSGWSVQDVAEALNASNLSLWASSQQTLPSSTTSPGFRHTYIACWRFMPRLLLCNILIEYMFIYSSDASLSTCPLICSRCC